MKNLIKALGIALLLFGVFAATNLSAQTAPAKTSTAAPAKNTDAVIGKDSKGRTLYQAKAGKGNPYYLNSKGAKIYEPKSVPTAAKKPTITNSTNSSK